MIPSLTPQGFLPPGIHEASWDEVETRFGHTPWRRRLLQGLRAAARSLAGAGCRTLYLDGSYVSAKQDPSDFDGCWEESGVNPALLDPVLLTFANGRAAQKTKYLGELFPASIPAEPRPPYRVFLDFFQRDEDDNPKGILSIDLVRYKP